MRLLFTGSSGPLIQTGISLPSFTFILLLLWLIFVFPMKHGLFYRRGSASSLVSVGFEAPSKPVDSFAVCVDAQLAQPDEHEPQKGGRIARGQPERLLNMPLNFLAMPRLILAEADDPMRIGQILIERQRPPTL